MSTKKKKQNVYLVDKILFMNELNYLIGKSGLSKTQFLIQNSIHYTTVESIGIRRAIMKNTYLNLKVVMPNIENMVYEVERNSLEHALYKYENGKLVELTKEEQRVRQDANMLKRMYSNKKMEIKPKDEVVRPEEMNNTMIARIMRAFPTKANDADFIVKKICSKKDIIKQTTFSKDDVPYITKYVKNYIRGV